MLNKLIKTIFRKEEPKEPKKELGSSSPPERMIRELLRENLNLMPIDMFYIDDPINRLSPSDRTQYLKHFADLAKDERLMERIRFLINRQAIKTLSFAKDNMTSSVIDVAGAANINGLATVKDDIEHLAVLHAKEQPRKETFNRHQVFPN